MKLLLEKLSIQEIYKLRICTHSRSYSIKSVTKMNQTLIPL